MKKKKRKNEAKMSRPITIRLTKVNLNFLNSLEGSRSQIINQAIGLLWSRFMEREERESYWRGLIYKK